VAKKQELGEYAKRNRGGEFVGHTLPGNKGAKRTNGTQNTFGSKKHQKGGVKTVKAFGVGESRANTKTGSP